eukprot:3341336-Pyramimonas_sp.AAC.1
MMRCDGVMTHRSMKRFSMSSPSNKVRSYTEGGANALRNAAAMRRMGGPLRLCFFLGGLGGRGVGQCNCPCKRLCCVLGHAQPVAALEIDRVFEDGNLNAARGGHKCHSQ